ncbi:MAG: hypothetical protein PVI86_02620 [Phycisphaerae bacterium]|jgi:hypothetical protein
MRKDTKLTLNMVALLGAVCIAAGVLCGLAVAKDRGRATRLIDTTRGNDFVTVVDPSGELVEIDVQALKDAIDEQDLTFVDSDLHRELYLLAFGKFMDNTLMNPEHSAMLAGLWATTAASHYEQVFPATAPPPSAPPPTAPE